MGGSLRPPGNFTLAAANLILAGPQGGREAHQLSRARVLGADVYGGTEGAEAASADVT